MKNPSSVAELEIGLFPLDREEYSVELRYSQEQDSEERAPARGTARFDLAALRSKSLDRGAYGAQLSSDLFNDPALRSYYQQVMAHGAGQTLRIRLSIDPSAAELHDLRWETLCDPLDGNWLLTSEQVLFSRFLSSANWEQAHWRAKSKLKALVVIANPNNLEEYQPTGRKLASIDVPGELERARKSLGSLPTTVLSSRPEEPGQASMNNLVSALHEGIDILYIACHGLLSTDQPAIPTLVLEGADGRADLASGQDLAERVRDLPVDRRPRLVVLASCQSAGSGEGLTTSDPQGAQAALGPILAQAGVPAVLAMQGSVSLQTLAEFMPAFFSELLKDGQIDRAMAAARGMVRDRLDAWMPVLFLRLRGGKLWYTPGFSGETGKYESTWSSLATFINFGRCTPILGPGLTDHLFGTRRELADSWAKANNYPLGDASRENLPQVAQFLASTQGEVVPQLHFLSDLRQQILKMPQRLPEWETLADDELFVQAGRAVIEEPSEIHAILACLPLPIYITTNPDPLLSEALRKNGKTPNEVLCPWRPEERLPPELTELPRPDVDHPLVFYLFGNVSQPDSLVLTEDNYFDFLIGVKQEKDRIPRLVRSTLADTALLFLGFQMDDWNFRVLFRSIMQQQGRELLRRYQHVSVQMDPSEEWVREPRLLHDFLEKYFEPANINIYWGQSGDFIAELWERWENRQG